MHANWGWYTYTCNLSIICNGWSKSTISFFQEIFGGSSFCCSSGRSVSVTKIWHLSCSEAMFADLGHFNRRPIQMAFLFTIYPSLVLTCVGQTAYLIKHPNDHKDGFYKFVPQTIY